MYAHIALHAQRKTSSNMKAGFPVRGSRGSRWGGTGSNGGYGDFPRASATHQKDASFGGELCLVLVPHI